MPSLHRRLKHRDIRVTLDGLCRPPRGCCLSGFAYPLSLSIHVPSQHTMSLFLVRGRLSWPLRIITVAIPGAALRWLA